MSSGDLSSWRIPVGLKEAEAGKLEVQGMAAQAAKTGPFRPASRKAATGRSLVYLILLIAVIAVIVLALVLW